jgi:hypothetical protein
MSVVFDSALGTVAPTLDPKSVTSSLEEATAGLQNANLHDASSSEETLVDKGSPAVRRRLGDTEASYFLPSRESGVNDMCVLFNLSNSQPSSSLFRYLMLGLNTAGGVMARNRVNLVWAIMRIRHPLLASTIEMDSYEDIYFK